MSPRRFTIHEPNAYVFVSWSCHKKLHLFSPDRIKRSFLVALEQSRERYLFFLIAYVIMSNHVHLLLRVDPDHPLETVARTLKRTTAFHGLRWLHNHDPDLHSQLQVHVGTQWTQRFWMAGGGFVRWLTDEERILRAIQYIHDNPVRAEIVRDSLHYPWSSARAWEVYDVPSDSDPDITILIP